LYLNGELQDEVERPRQPATGQHGDEALAITERVE